MPRFSQLVLLLTSLYAATGAAVVPCRGQESQTLKPGLSVHFEPLDPRFAPGKTFQQELAADLIKKPRPDNNWFVLPSWRAGYWEEGPIEITFRRDEITGKEDRDHHAIGSSANIGTRRTWLDRTGQVWEQEQEGAFYSADRGTNTVYSYLQSRTQASATDTECGFDRKVIVFTVDKATGKISGVVQELTHQDFCLISPNSIKEKTSNRLFDWLGNSFRTEEIESTANKVPALAWPSDVTMPYGKRLYAEFVQFLKDNGMADRIPDPHQGVQAAPEAPNKGNFSPPDYRPTILKQLGRPRSSGQ